MDPTHYYLYCNMVKIIKILIYSIYFIICCSKTEVKKVTPSINEYEKPLFNSAEDSPLGNIDIKLEGTIGSDIDDKYMFSIILDMQVDKKGNLYVLDKGFENLRVFNQLGKYIKEYKLTKGEGPGEFIKPETMTFSKDESEILIWDMNLRRTSIMNKQDFNFKESFKLMTHYTDIYGGPDRLVTAIYLNRFASKKDKVIHVFNNDGREIFSYCHPQEIIEEITKEYLQNAHYAYNTKLDSLLFLSFSYPYEIRIYNFYERKFIRRFTKKTSFFHGSYMRKNEFTFPSGRCCGLAVLPDSLILNFVLNTKDEKTFIHAFDFNGHNRGIIDMSKFDFKLYPIGESTVAFKDKFFLFAIEPYPMIVIFRVLYQKK